jgi:hypothetical protein
MTVLALMLEGQAGHGAGGILLERETRVDGWMKNSVLLWGEATLGRSRWPERLGREAIR